VARAIAASRLPVVSAVGHEVDFSIADMVADARAPTPSAAAELLSPDQQEWLRQLAAVEDSLLGLVRRRLSDAATQLLHLRRRLRHPGSRLRENAQRLDELEQRLVRSQRHLLRRRQDHLALLSSRLLARSPLPALHQARRELDSGRSRLETAMRQKLRTMTDRLAYLGELLESLSPLGTLERGYAIVTDSSGRVVRDAGQVAVGDEVEVRLARGRLGLTVTRTGAD